MDTKICTQCKRELPATTDFFHPRKDRPCGLNAWCRECHLAYNRKTKRKRYREEPWYKERELKRTRDYWKKHPDKKLENNKKDRERYKINKKDKEWVEKERIRCQIKAHKQRIHKRNQTPDLTQDEKHQMEMIYRKSQELGQDWQVDHIIPLSKGGLHHPDNLQIVTKKYNLEKGNNENFRDPLDWEVWKI